MDTSTLDLFGYFRLKAELETSEKNTDESEKGGKKESEKSPGKRPPLNESDELGDDLRHDLAAWKAEGDKQWDTCSTILNLFSRGRSGPTCPKCKSGNMDLGYG